MNIGRHTGQKDPLTMLAAWERFAAAHPGALLLLVGDGELTPQLKETVSARGLDSSVRFEGWRTNIVEYLAAADVFLSASLFEGTHIALGEAMAAGLPVIATPVGGALDFVHDGQNGFLVPLGGVSEIADRLARLASDAGLRARLGKVARRTAEEMLEQDATARKHLDALFAPLPRSTARRRTRVTHLIATLDRGGSEQQMATLAAELDRNRFDVNVLCLTRGGPVAETLDRAGVPYSILGKAGKADPFAFLRLIWRFLAQPPTILHTWLFTSNAYGRAAGAIVGVRHLLASERSTDPWKRPVHRFLDRLLARVTDRVIANSRAVAESLIFNGIPDAKIAIIPNNVDTSRFRPREAVQAREALGLAPGGPYMGYIGRLAFEKRPELFVEAAKRVLAARQDVRAVLFGTGPLEAALKAAAAEFSDRIIFYGDCREVELAHAALDVLVLTSSWEGFPNVVLEAIRIGAAGRCGAHARHGGDYRPRRYRASRRRRCSGHRRRDARASSRPGAVPADGRGGAGASRARILGRDNRRGIRARLHGSPHRRD